MVEGCEKPTGIPSPSHTSSRKETLRSCFRQVVRGGFWEEVISRLRLYAPPPAHATSPSQMVLQAAACGLGNGRGVAGAAGQRPD